MKAITWLVRIGIFLVLAVIVWFSVLAVNLVVVPLTMESLTTTAYPPGYKPTVTFPAVVVVLFSIIALFRLIVLRKSIRELLIALGFYIGCNTVATLMIVAGEPELAPTFSWAGLAGLGLYFLIIKPFKKGWAENSTPS